MTLPQFQKGFVALPVVILFSVIMLIILSSLVERTTFTARHTHRILLSKQADMLAVSAIEYAINDLLAKDNPKENGEKEYAESIATVFISDDPLKENPPAGIGIIRSMTARYSYQYSTVQNLSQYGLSSDQTKRAYIITGHAEIPYRDIVLQSTFSKLCVLQENGDWETQPMIEE